MEGPLSKWTNVMQGWQYRWFVLDDTAGVLLYYTSKEKMTKGQRRGCVRLKGAVIGIDDEDDSTFTVTVDQKMFHFQARDADERDAWIRALEVTIQKHSGYYRIAGRERLSSSAAGNIEKFQRKIQESDAYLEMIIQQVKSLEEKIGRCDNLDEKEKLERILNTSNALLETVKHSIVLLQIAKSQIFNPSPGGSEVVVPFDDSGLPDGLPVFPQPPLTAANSTTPGYPPLSAVVEGKRHSAAPTGKGSRPTRRTPADHPTSLAGTTSKSVYSLGTSVDGDPPPPSTGINRSHSLSLSDAAGTVGQSSDQDTSSDHDPVSDYNDHPDSSSAILVSIPARPLSSEFRIPSFSYSSSGEEDNYFDAEEDTRYEGLSAIDNVGLPTPDDRMPPINSVSSGSKRGSLEAPSMPNQVPQLNANSTESDVETSGIDYDALYETQEEEDIESMEEHGSVVMHLLSQLSVGMDLTKIVLPTFILERRSLLELYADFFAHPDLFVRIPDMPTAEERMLQVLRWYLSSFHASRKSAVAKKPYNPIIGETFRCYWDLPGHEKSGPLLTVDDGPFPGSSSDQLTFLAEQVSHHPPVSAIYGECPVRRLQFDAHIWTKSKFLGLSIGVHMIGKGCVSVLDHDEEYIATFPSAYGRSILTTPWVELGGKCQISCSKTGYSAEIEFQTKPFYGGKVNGIKADVFRPDQRAAFMTVKGTWNGVMHAKTANSDTVFLDINQLNIIKKRCLPVKQQQGMESRRLWRHVTLALSSKDVSNATEAKQALEHKQRTEAKQRASHGLSWNPKCFQEVGENWIYKWPLQKRLLTNEQLAPLQKQQQL